MPPNSRSLVFQPVDSPAESTTFNPERFAAQVTRLGLALVLAWIGGMKFTGYEANGIEGLISNSPLMSWTYQLPSVRSVSGLIGVIEIGIAVMMVTRSWSARISAWGSLLASGLFIVTLTFLISTPGVWEMAAGGFPALSVAPGQFLLKDVPLLGASLWTAAEAWSAGKASD